MSFRYLTFGRHELFKPARTRTDGVVEREAGVRNSGNCSETMIYDCGRSMGEDFDSVVHRAIPRPPHTRRLNPVAVALLLWAPILLVVVAWAATAFILGDLPTWSQVLGIVGSW